MSRSITMKEMKFMRLSTAKVSEIQSKTIELRPLGKKSPLIF
jgi:hypothetical protein